METLGAPIRALLVEDDEDDYAIIRDMLFEIPELSFTLQWVKDLDSAMRAVSDASYDICLPRFRKEQSGPWFPYGRVAGARYLTFTGGDGAATCPFRVIGAKGEPVSVPRRPSIGNYINGE